MVRTEISLIVLGLLSFAVSPTPADEGLSIDFDLEIRPILSNHCFRCHGPDRNAQVSARRLDSRQAMTAEVGGLRAADPGRPEQSELIRRVSSGDPDEHMPPPHTTPPLSADQIDKLRRWIREGARWPQHWAWRPLRAGNLPAGQFTRSFNAIDAHVSHRLDRASLTRSVEADRRTLIRRVTMDLTGMPPDRDQVDRFVNDRRPDAYERLVDRLLASPHYGERWARAWLDLARYSDTTAEWLQGMGQAWVYRDWVIEAFNQDLPYDRFAKMQLAADSHPDSAEFDQAALGFLGLSPTYWKELRLSPEVIKRIVADEWDERLDAVTRTFLGLTVSCARCHDHKFDPITTEDYYALAGVFASTQFADHPLTTPEKVSRFKQARHRLTQLQAEYEAANSKPAELEAEIARLSAEIDQVVWAHAVEDSSVYVLPEGADRTKLEYRRGMGRDLPIYYRGDPAKPGPIVERRFLSALSQGEPRRLTTGSGRAELAESIFSPGARALAARVMVNRIWQQHFGQGIVRTPSNFGSQGEPPSHPRLLDWLADELIRGDWSLKRLHRAIVTSATYRQSSRLRARAHELDPANRLMWRMNRRQIDAEMWRDTLLSVSHCLDRRMGGPSLPLDAANNHRRTLYGRIARRDVDRFLRLYDFPEPTAHSPRRQPTTTPLQQLFVLNSPFFDSLAEAVAAGLPKGCDDAHRIYRCYEQLFARSPTERELALGLRFVQSADDSTAWRDYVHSLLALNELLFLD